MERPQRVSASDRGAPPSLAVSRTPPFRCAARFSRDEVVYVIRDDGPGFDPSTLADPYRSRQHREDQRPRPIPDPHVHGRGELQRRRQRSHDDQAPGVHVDFGERQSLKRSSAGSFAYASDITPSTSVQLAWKLLKSRSGNARSAVHADVPRGTWEDCDSFQQGCGCRNAFPQVDCKQRVSVEDFVSRPLRDYCGLAALSSDVHRIFDTNSPVAPLSATVPDSPRRPPRGGFAISLRLGT